jgi:hypothetical protein
MLGLELFERDTCGIDSEDATAELIASLSEREFDLL